MSTLRARKIAPLLTAITVACGSLSFVAEPAEGAGALFRAKRTWWFSRHPSWTNGELTPPTGPKNYRPPAVAYVGTTASNPRFTAPKSFIKNTTYYYRGCGHRPSGCYPGYPRSKNWYSYWNAKGSFRPQNANAPTTTTTIRFRTTMSEPYTASQWWRRPHTAMYAPVTPTTTWGGRYDFSRGGSIMIWPGKNRFGGTMRFFEGPNDRFYWLITIEGPYSTVTKPPKPLSQQIGTGVEITLGQVTEASIGLAYRLTEPNHAKRSVIGTTSMGGPLYYVREIHYLVTRAPYTTGIARAWEPNGNTNTIQTATGYDNRTPAGLNGIVSMVHPRLVHAYTVSRPGSGKPIKMNWSSARMRKIDFRFLPEPASVAAVVVGLSALVGLDRWRSRVREPRSERPPRSS